MTGPELWSLNYLIGGYMLGNDQLALQTDHSLQITRPEQPHVKPTTPELSVTAHSFNVNTIMARLTLILLQSS